MPNYEHVFKVVTVADTAEMAEQQNATIAEHIAGTWAMAVVTDVTAFGPLTEGEGITAALIAQ